VVREWCRGDCGHRSFLGWRWWLNSSGRPPQGRALARSRRRLPPLGGLVRGRSRRQRSIRSVPTTAMAWASLHSWRHRRYESHAPAHMFRGKPFIWVSRIGRWWYFSVIFPSFFQQKKPSLYQVISVNHTSKWTDYSDLDSMTQTFLLLHGNLCATSSSFQHDVLSATKTLTTCQSLCSWFQ
jgi:hypothetical protein